MSVYPNLSDVDGLLASCAEGRALGFVGRAALHPKQLSAIVEGFRPSPEEVVHSASLLAAVAGAAATESGTVVLPDGGVLHTGMGAFAASNSGSVYRYGIGPVLDGLFSQSNLGIVTEMTLELMPRPEAISVFALTIKKPTNLGPTIRLFRELKDQHMADTPSHA